MKREGEEDAEGSKVEGDGESESLRSCTGEMLHSLQQAGGPQQI